MHMVAVGLQVSCNRADVLGLNVIDDTEDPLQELIVIFQGNEGLIKRKGVAVTNVEFLRQMMQKSKQCTRFSIIRAL